ncbi:glycosyltransferase family 2 protein [Cryobacterium sp. BB736]|uniref:glycosyltransferase family 2 protein n=1 Tax=Cryobacterium sp. BB736 TaxID=2746963 RepID=UPI00187397B5|nr:glycosyltransferase family 2 protein [Cryobacterium sp. BB736]
MTHTAQRIAVITVTWNSASVIAEFLTSVQASRFNGELQVIVVDNESADATLEVVHRVMPSAVLVSTGRNAGYAAGVNAGIRRAEDCDAYLVLNPDLRLDPDAVQIMADTLASGGSGIVVPRLVDRTGGVRYSIRRDPTVLRAWGEALLGGNRAGRFHHLGEVERHEDAYRIERTVDWATGAAMLISRECASAVGEWDETYFLYSEETDYALRARDAGFVIRYTPAAQVVHLEGESHEAPALFALLTRNRVKLYRSRHGALRSAMFWLAVTAGELLRCRSRVHRAALWALLGRRGVVAQPGD